MPLKYVHTPYKFPKKFKTCTDYTDLEIPLHTARKPKRKVLFIIDFVPTEDIISSRYKFLGGETGKLLQNLLAAAVTKFGANNRINTMDWAAISYNAFKTSHLSPEDKEEAYKVFNKRINYVITKYKPDVVVTFGPRPFRALCSEQIHAAENNIQNFFGVPVPTTVKHKGTSLSFRTVANVSLTPLIKARGNMGDVYLCGYMARCLVSVLNLGQLKYSIPDNPKFDVTYVDTMKKFRTMMKRIVNKPLLSIDTETTSLNRIKTTLLTIQFATSTDHAYVLPMYHKDTPFLASELLVIKKALVEFFETNNNKEHIYVNASFDLNVFRSQLGQTFFKTDLWDVFAGEFCLDENLKFLPTVTGYWYYSLGNLAMQYGCSVYYKIAFGKKQRVTIKDVDLDDDVIQYAALDVIIPLYIREQQIRRGKDIRYAKYCSMVTQQQSDLLHTFSTMENNGVPVDIDYLFYLREPDSPIRKELESVKQRLYDTKGVQQANKELHKESGAPKVGLFGKVNKQIFNIGKALHKQKLFFDVLHLTPLALGKDNNGKLDKFFQQHYSDIPEVRLFTELSKAQKLYNSYVKQFIKYWGSSEDFKNDRRIRPSFDFLGVVTGRTSASKPSLHQIPSRSELGKHIKRLFITPEGQIILKVDYAAHEVRCLHLESYVSTEIGMIKLGDLIDMVNKPRVYSFNHTTQEVELKAVCNESKHTTSEDMFEIEYATGAITVTGNHKVWSLSRNAYIRADVVEEQEELIQAGGSHVVKVKSVKKIPTPEFVGDIGVADNHNLFICDDIKDTPVLVHNCWSIITFDELLAKVFQVGYDLRKKFKLRPSKKLAKRIELEGDPHKINAAFFFKKAIGDVTKAIRNSVKTVVFGLIYQQGTKGLANSTGNTEKEIVTLTKKFLARFPKGVGWFDEIKKFGQANMYVESPVGRRRNLWGFLLPKDMDHVQAIFASMLRRSVNSPVQGMASDFLICGARCFEVAKFNMSKVLNRPIGMWLCNSVHDSLEIWVDYKDMMLALRLLEESLTTDVQTVMRKRHGMEFTIPLEIDFEIGCTLRDTQEWGYSYVQLRKIVHDTLLLQRDMLKHDINITKTMTLIFDSKESVTQMPIWLRKQRADYIKRKQVTTTKGKRRYG